MLKKMSYPLSSVMLSPHNVMLGIPVCFVLRGVDNRGVGYWWMGLNSGRHWSDLFSLSLQPQTISKHLLCKVLNQPCVLRGELFKFTAWVLWAISSGQELTVMISSLGVAHMTSIFPL
jgi:hypothetical protein